MKIVPYLNFKGNAEEALQFYAPILGGKVTYLMRYKDKAWEGMPPSLNECIMHGELTFDGGALYASDAFEVDKVNYGNAFSIHLDLDSKESVEAIFNGLKEGGTVDMPLEETFWGAFYGSLTDRYGIMWSLNFQMTPL